VTGTLDDKLKTLVLDAAKCNLMAGLAEQSDERKLFRSLGKQYLKMANEVCDVIESRLPGGLSTDVDDVS
jgi:hypothetical protein